MEKSERYLSLAMRVYGILIAFATTTFFWWPEVGRWPPYHPPYERMFIAIFFAWGLCLINGSFKPKENLGLADFTAIQGLFHGTVMTVDTILGNAGQHGYMHFIGDVFLHLSAPLILIPLRNKVSPLRVQFNNTIKFSLLIYGVALIYLGFFKL